MYLYIHLNISVMLLMFHRISKGNIIIFIPLIQTNSTTHFHLSKVSDCVSTSVNLGLFTVTRFFKVMLHLCPAGVRLSQANTSKTRAQLYVVTHSQGRFELT